MAKRYEITEFLTREEETDLVVRWKQTRDPKVSREILRAYEPFIMKTAARANKRYPQIDLDDCAQVARMKFLSSLDGFDPTLGNRLSSYMEQRLQDAVKNQSRYEATNRPSSGNVNRTIQLELRAALVKHVEYNVPMSTIFRDVAERMNISPERVEKVFLRNASPRSLDEPIKQGETLQLGDLIADNNTINPLDRIDSGILLGLIEAGLETLNERERSILARRFGLTTDGEIEKQGDVAKSLGVSSARVHQLEKKIMENLRRFLEENGYDSSNYDELLPS